MLNCVHFIQALLVGVAFLVSVAFLGLEAFLSLVVWSEEVALADV